MLRLSNCFLCFFFRVHGSHAGLVILLLLKVLLKDARVHLIKNRFDTCYEANATAGCRDMNLQLSFAKLDGTDFEGFIFELQIHVEAILKLKSAEGHKRYIVLRNLRGA